MKRVWDFLVGSVMIALSLAVQMFLYCPLAFGMIGLWHPYEVPEGADDLAPMIVVGLALVFNGIACFEYFRRKRQATLGGRGLRPGIHAFKAITSPDSGHIAWAIFLVPRGLDRILFGKERLK
jgi:hypothetical protein